MATAVLQQLASCNFKTLHCKRDDGSRNIDALYSTCSSSGLISKPATDDRSRYVCTTGSHCPDPPMPCSLPRSHAVACFRSYPMCAIAPVWHVQQQTIQCSKLPPQWAPMQIRLRLRRSPGSHAGLLGHRLCGGGKWCVRSVVPAACLGCIQCVEQVRVRADGQDHASTSARHVS